MNRLYKEGLITSIIGLIILGISMYMWISGKATQLDCLGMATFAIPFMSIKDKHIGIKRKDKKECE